MPSVGPQARTAADELESTSAREDGRDTFVLQGRNSHLVVYWTVHERCKVRAMNKVVGVCTLLATRSVKILHQKHGNKGDASVWENSPYGGIISSTIQWAWNIPSVHYTEHRRTE